MPFGLFGKKEKEEIEDLGKIKSESLLSDKATSGRGLLELPELPKRSLPGISEPKESSFPLKPKLEFKPKLTPRLEFKPKFPPKPEIKKVSLEELPLKDLSKKINEELESIKKEFKNIRKVQGLTLESPELIDLLNLYIKAKRKLRDFTDEINKTDLSGLTSKRTVAAVYKFRACRTLSEIKKEVIKIDKICKKAGFIPIKVNQILKSSAEELVNSFLREKKEEKKKK